MSLFFYKNETLQTKVMNIKVLGARFVNTPNLKDHYKLFPNIINHKNSNMIKKQDPIYSSNL